MRNNVEMNVIVTGSAGFIGSAITASFLESGLNVISLDSFTDYYSVGLKKVRSSMLDKKFGHKVFDIDITDYNKVCQIFKKYKPELVVHLAAQAGVRLPINQTYKYVDSNLKGFGNVLQATVLDEVPNFFYASSSSVYGERSSIPYAESETKLEPKSFYGGTKLANEVLTKTLVANSKTSARGARFFTVYGPWGRPDMAYFRIITSALNNSQFTLYGDGKIERDFTFIDDVIKFSRKLIKDLETREPGFNDLVNIGGGRPKSVEHMINSIESILNCEIDIVRRNQNSNDVSVTSASGQYLNSIIGPHEYKLLDDGLRSTIEWASSEEIRFNLKSWAESTI